uniref:protein suex-1-like n=1 Tax=Pristiophorus japonicus TaxID=55135 RepID=UPI00398EFF69
MATLGSLKDFTVGNDWETFTERLEYYFTANDLTGNTDAQREKPPTELEEKEAVHWQSKFPHRRVDPGRAGIDQEIHRRATNRGGAHVERKSGSGRGYGGGRDGSGGVGDHGYGGRGGGQHNSGERNSYSGGYLSQNGGDGSSYGKYRGHRDYD